ncbi:MAG TPA: hypothetical protein VI893_07985 [Thermoplasmata archaeon]|nr:hypothetical protein [Thermoplasmata archaeon]
MRSAIIAMVALLLTTAATAPVAAIQDNEGPRAARLHHRELPAVSDGPSSPSSSIEFWKNYSDPANDVMMLHANGTPVIVNSSFVFVTDHDSVDVKWVRSGLATDNTTVNIVLEVGRNSEILELANTTYTFNLYSDATNRSRYIVNYSDGVATLRNNASAGTADLSGNVTLSGPNPQKLNTLTIAVRKTLLKNLTAWNIYATARQDGSPYSYQDFGWEVPGNPGSTPTPPPPSPPPVYQQWLPYLIAALLVLALVAVVVVLTRKKKRGVEPARK